MSSQEKYLFRVIVSMTVLRNNVVISGSIDNSDKAQSSFSNIISIRLDNISVSICDESLALMRILFVGTIDV